MEAKETSLCVSAIQAAEISGELPHSAAGTVGVMCWQALLATLNPAFKGFETAARCAYDTGSLLPVGDD